VNIFLTLSRQKPWFKLLPHCWRKIVGPPQCWGPAAALLLHSALEHPRPAEESLGKGMQVLAEAIATQKSFFSCH